MTGEEGCANGNSFELGDITFLRRVKPWKFGVGPASMIDDRDD